jgi:hypothetical protein
MEFGLVNGFIDHLYTRLLITSNYSATANLHNSQITAAITKPFPVNGHAVAQAVCRWLPTSAARVRDRAACGVCGGQSGTRADFLRVLRFPLPIIPPISPSS